MVKTGTQARGVSNKVRTSPNWIVNNKSLAKGGALTEIIPRATRPGEMNRPKPYDVNTAFKKIQENLLALTRESHFIKVSFQHTLLGRTFSTQYFIVQNWKKQVIQPHCEYSLLIMVNNICVAKKHVIDHISLKNQFTLLLFIYFFTKFYIINPSFIKIK